MTVDTPKALTAARMKLGMDYVELANALRLKGSEANVAKRISDMENGIRPISGPISVAVQAMLEGFNYDD